MTKHATYREGPSLRGINEKIARAKLHMEVLEKQWSPLADLEPQPFRCSIYDAGRKHVYRADNPPRPHPDTGVILGDCVHNLRSALDHLAWELVRISERGPGRRTQFPILDSAPMQRRCLVKRQVPVTIRPSVREEIRRLVEHVQPYSGTEAGQWLWQLNELDVVDKHRHLIVTMSAIDTAWTATPDASELPLIKLLPAPLAHNEVVATVTYPVSRNEPDPHLHFQLGVRFDRSVGARFDRQPLRSVLGNIIWTVEDEVVPLFAPFFPTAD